MLHCLKIVLVAAAILGGAGLGAPALRSRFRRRRNCRRA